MIIRQLNGNRNGRVCYYYDFDIDNAVDWYQEYKNKSENENIWDEVYDGFSERYFETEEERRQNAYDEYMEELGDEDRLYDYDE